MRHLTHAIADIVFAPDGASLICQCGEDVHGTEDGLNEPFQQHRLAHGEPRRAFSSSELAAPGDAISWRDRNSIKPNPEDRRIRRERERPETDDHLRGLWREASQRYRDRRKGEVAA